MKSKILKFSKSLVKILLPAVSKILIKLKLNRRVINFLHEKSYNSNFKHNFTSLLEKFLEKNKIVALDVGAQGGFNSDAFFPKKYDHFFDEILIEPINSEAKKIKSKNLVINKGLWSEKINNLSGLEIDIVYEWELGSMLIFDRTRLHCSSSLIEGKKIGLTTFTKK